MFASVCVPKGLCVGLRGDSVCVCEGGVAGLKSVCVHGCDQTVCVSMI